ncbi:helicase C-terminal domain-containing protein [Pelagicoccus sp. SDUM812003]|uniref:ATP-dependent DNA helicase n=1 Tax=Pelagicoccus sp. SDUM812003 TaxID=3041267 RepID=UPI00280E9D22|nr:helicase C-terminal domain-containing protein [Pelagicoccus sp. SDUM812003]MDQ8205092.1 helicase C-terminal domain-containing protein [Pelagicoccus sp. SDUM812003]
MISPNDRESAQSSVFLPDLVARIFKEGGWLQSAMGLEHRPQQEQMARSVAAGMHLDEPLIFEAGTGVGKSLAYLLPGIIHATETQRPCVISSNTIALQEQLEQKDLKICRNLFGSIPQLEKYAEFKSAVLVGKGNYLCPTRLANAVRNKTELFPTDEFEELQRIAAWAEYTKTGLRQELNPQPSWEVWEQVNAEGSACNRKNCSHESCHYQRARAEIRKAQIVIVNHSLLFALINAGGLAPGAKGILLPDDFLVIDEGHTTAEVATEHFGARISSYGLDRQLKILFNPKRKKGMISKFAYPQQIQAIIDAQEAAQEFFGYLIATYLAKRPVVRISEEGWCEPTIIAPLRAAVQTMDSILSKIEDGPMHDELKDQRGRLHSYYANINRFIGLAEEDHVHWLEKSGRHGHICTLRTAPIDIAPYLREELFNKEISVTLTSATLSIARDMKPFQLKVGAEHEQAESVDSPFDYENHTRIYVATDVPAPSPQDASRSVEVLTDYVRFCVSKVSGGSLVLFTSYAVLKQVAAALETEFQAAGRPFFAQGQGLSRSDITAAFREAGNGVLFGTESFWTGVDVPGPALSQVIITRLPFDVPTHPITEAKSEYIKERGGHPFSDLTLPEALVRFRQGIGRLIRTKDDKGLITVLDSRILQKSYGRQFLQSLPKQKFIRISQADREARFVDINESLPSRRDLGNEPPMTR